jgi:site-specific recombinase XerC
MDVDASPAAVLLAGFRSWLVAERGLSAETVRCYCNQACTFLGSLPEPVDSSVQQLDSGRVTSFMVDYCQGRNTWSAKAMATSLRALLRYLHVCGHTPTGLVGAVPGVAGWRRCRAGWTRLW